VLIVPLTVQWWSVWYPGAEPGGGSYIAQRILASKNERHALGATLWFNVAHYALRPWPWIIVALCSMIVFPTVGDITRALPNLDPRLLGNDTAYSAMLTFLPHGIMGVMVAGLLAAYVSTLSTHLNWGTSYLVHDFYRRFIRRDATEHHYVTVGRLATIGLFICASGVVYLMDTAKDAFDVILQVGAGTGLLYLVRWFWWRVNAWCEVVAMVVSFGVSVVLLVLAKQGAGLSTHVALLVTIAITTTSWIATAFIAPPTDREVLIDFYRKVRPFGPGWTPIRQAAGVSLSEEAAAGDNIPLALLGWMAGCAAVWSSLFAVGSVLYGEYGRAAALTTVFVVSGFVLLRVVQKIWASRA